MRWRERKRKINANNHVERKLCSLSIVIILFLTSFTTFVVFIPSTAKAEWGEQTVDLLPDGEGTVQEWEPVPIEFPTPVHYTKVDDPVGEPDEDETHVCTTTWDAVEEFNHEISEDLEDVTITNVRVNVRAKTQFVLNQINIGVKVNGIRYGAAADTSLTGFYADYYKDWATNPDTESAWTKDDIDRLQSSLQCKALDVWVYVTQVYITVTYAPPSVILYPDGDGKVHDWTPYAESEPEPEFHYLMVDEETPDEDDTYIYTNRIDSIEEFHHKTSEDLEGVTITNVRVTARMKKLYKFNAVKVNIGLKINLNRYGAASDKTLTVEYTDYYNDWATNPATESAWTNEDVVELQTSLTATLLTSIEGPAEARCTQIYITVTYASPSVILYPDGDGEVHDWTPYSEGDPEPKFHYLMVDEVTPDEDDTYIYTNRIDSIEEFHHKSSEELVGVTITNVRVTARMKMVVMFPAEAVVNIGLNIRGERHGAEMDETLTDSYADYYEDWATNPATKQAWTKEEIESLQSSIKLKVLDVDSVRCTQIYIMVSYTIPSIISSFSPSDSSPNNGEVVTFDGSGSTNAVNWAWDFENDGIFDDSGEVVYHSFKRAGNYTVNLTVEDISHREDYSTQDISVKQRFKLAKDINNGIGYIVWGLANTDSDILAKDNLLGLHENDLFGVYDPNLEPSGGYHTFVYGEGGENFNINTYDVVMIILNESDAIDVSRYPGEYEESKTVDLFDANGGLNYFSWGNTTDISMSTLAGASYLNLPVGYAVYRWNTTTGNWDTYIKGISESFDVTTYDIIVTYVDGPKNQVPIT